MTAMPFAPDFSRHNDLLDHELLSRARVAVVGVGGAAGLVTTLARCGVRDFILVDPDIVSRTNPTTQAHDLVSIGMPKVDALARRLTLINPAITGRAFATRYEDLSEREFEALWRTDLVLAMTDRFATQGLINRDALTFGTDTVFAIAYPDAVAVEITATFHDTVAAGHGCHRCHVKARYDAYAAGFENPKVLPSHALAAEYLNALLGFVAVSRLHYRAGSTLAIARTAEHFSRSPCLISRLDPRFFSEPGQAFGDAPSGFSLFTTKLWALDTPADWICPDCGTRGCVGAMRADALAPCNL